MFAGVVGAVFGIGGVGDVANIASSLALMKYSRGQEQEADYAGLRYMSEGGYNPTGMVELMRVLQTASGGKGPPQFLSTHPNPGNRLEYLSAAIEKQYAGAAASGSLGTENFKRYVLSRRPMISMRPLDLSQPEMWCLTCRRTAVVAIKTQRRELLHDVR